MNDFIKKLLERLDSIFKNGGNNWSSQRIMSIALVIIPLLVWMIISLVSWVVLPMPESIVALIAIGITGKVASKIAENKSAN